MANIKGTSAGEPLSGTAAADTIDGKGGDDVIRGLAGDDVIDGGNGDDVVYGGLGDDEIDGGQGDDELHGGRGDDVLRGGQGDDVLRGGRGDDELHGGQGDDDLRGGSGDDALDGGQGDDTLDGGTGDDVITTGSGHDAVIFRGDFGNDTVTDFDPKRDTIDLTKLPGVTSLDDLDFTVNSHGDVVITAKHGEFDGSITVEDVTIAELKEPGVIEFDAVCFLPGTLISTPTGEVAIETLKAGDLVSTSDGQTAPVRWVGRQTVSTRFADPLRVMPILVKKAALADNVPARDLYVSPDHALFMDGILVHAGALVNGTSIVRVEEMPSTFTYYHVELTDHSLILAEGVPAETFIDNVDRMAFDNWSEHEALDDEAAPMVELEYPRAKSARQVPQALRNRLAARGTVLYGSDLSEAA